MPITNIIDRRKRPYRFKSINAIIEPTRHDNLVKDSDIAKPNPKLDKSWMGYDEKEHISVAAAISWASSHKDDLTLYLYDKGAGI